MSADIDPDSLLLLVVGAHPQAERDDRPLAGRLAERVAAWVRNQPPDSLPSPLAPFVLSDLWYLNDEALRRRPTISIGEPEFNACSAYFANRLPDALVIDGTCRIQLDPEFIEVRACLCGANANGTGSAVDLFIERYLDRFLTAAHEM